MLASASTDPPAALTHAPLKRRPIPAVDIHGHLNGAKYVSTTTSLTYSWDTPVF